MLLIVSAMLRFRARSVFNTPVEVRPAPVAECYALGLRRVPWLLITEVLRNAAILVATFFLVLPALLLGFRLAFATEAVVLNESNTSNAFQRSFRLTEGRFERWLEMIVVSVVLILAIVLTVAISAVLIPGPTSNAWVSITLLLITAVTPVIQYAWTFFYMRLVEIEVPPAGVEVGPAYAEARPFAGGEGEAPSPAAGHPGPAPSETLAAVPDDSNETANGPGNPVTQESSPA